MKNFFKQLKDKINENMSGIKHSNELEVEGKTSISNTVEDKNIKYTKETKTTQTISEQKDNSTKYMQKIEAEKEINSMKENENMSGVRYTDKEANEKGFFFRINGRNCKIMSYKGQEECPVVPDYINAKPVRAIGKKAFFKKNIKGIVLPDTLREIKEEAFRECNLEAVELPQYIERIEKSAFELCKNLTSVTIKENRKQS